MKEMKEILKELDEIEKLEYNWDGYGAVAVDKSVIDKVRYFINNINKKYMDMMEISPSPYSTVEVSIGKYNIEFGKNSIYYEMRNDVSLEELKGMFK